MRGLIEQTTVQTTLLAAGFDLCSLSFGIMGAIIPTLHLSPAYFPLLPMWELLLAIIALAVAHRTPSLPSGIRTIITVAIGGLAIFSPTVILMLYWKSS